MLCTLALLWLTRGGSVVHTYDIVIIGGGVAGFTAGMYAARDRCRALLIERFSAGGQVLNCEHIENYPGFPDGIAGYTLGPLLQQHATNLGLAVQLAEVQAVRLEGDLKVVQTDEGEVRAPVVIVAVGSSFTKLGIPGEEEFAGKGVSHCAACDGAFFMNQAVRWSVGGTLRSTKDYTSRGMPPTLPSSIAATHSVPVGCYRNEPGRRTS